MADGPYFHPSWKQQGGHKLEGSTWGLDLGRNAGISTQMDSNELNQTSQMTQRRGTSQGGITIGPNPPGNSGVQTQMRSTQAGGKKRKQQGGSRTLDYSKWDGGPNQNPGAFWPFPGNAGVYTDLEASTPYGDSGNKIRGPKLGGINVIPGQIQGNAGEKLQLLSTDLEASTPYGDSGNKIRGPKLGGINVIPGQIQGNAGEKLQLLSTQAGGKKKTKSKPCKNLNRKKLKILNLKNQKI